MLNLDLLRIPSDDEFEEEEDELASAGFRVVDGEEEPAEEDGESVEDELEKEAGGEDEDEDAEDAVGGDGLSELEDMEKDMAEVPLGYDEEEE